MTFSLTGFLRKGKPAIEIIPFPYLTIVPILLAILTVVALFVHSDINAALIWSQCHSLELLPGLVKNVPLLGQPLCYLVSFFHAALDSVRSKAVMNVILAFVGGLLSVSLVEAARRGNAGAVLIKNPTGSWLVFNLLGGAVVWQLVIIPSFLHWGRRTLKDKEDGRRGAGERQQGSQRNNNNDDGNDVEDGGVLDNATDEVDKTRYISDEETVAIPVSVALGFYLLSILMVVLNSPVVIGLWLFFPVFVSAIRASVRLAVRWVWRARGSGHLHFESSWWALTAVYAVPTLCSVLAHLFCLYHFIAQKDDRRDITRSTVRLIEVDAQFIGLTVLYWMLVEVGWRTPLLMLGLSVVLGPGAGICLGWLFREKEILDGLNKPIDGDDTEEARGEGEEEERQATEPTEETALLR